MGSNRMIHTALRLPQELIQRLDEHLDDINGNDDHGRTLTRSNFMRNLVIKALEEEDDE